MQNPIRRMTVRIEPRPLRGVVQAIPSKSEAHRALVCAALSDAPCVLRMRETSRDVEATIRCLRTFGAEISQNDDGIRVVPIRQPVTECDADCGESGSTLRFLLPVAAALGIRARFHLHGQLPERPIAPLDRELTRGGCEIRRPAPEILEISGKLCPGEYTLPGDVSSQFVTGMLLALSVLEGNSALKVCGKVESADYIHMTLDMMARFGNAPEASANNYRIHGGRFIAPKDVKIGGDWSNAAFWLCADALPDCDICVEGLDPASVQGDRRILWELRAFAEAGDEHVIDAADIPDLIPALAVCACASGKTLTVTNAARLRIKESDRLRAICAVIRDLGGHAEEIADGLRIRGGALRGGTVDSASDHRIAMMAAILSVLCREPVVLCGAETVEKSDPAFWDTFARLSGSVEVMNGGNL